ncbi:MAG: acetyltransferase [Gemmatimonadaceae bacterium]
MADDRDLLLKLDAARIAQRTLVDVLRTAYEEAGLSGLCEEGRLEVALGAMKEYDVRRLFPDMNEKVT